MKQHILLIIISFCLLSCNNNKVKLNEPSVMEQGGDFIDDFPHLKFSGIPIAGTLTSFESKLLQKDFTISKSPESKKLPRGRKAYLGYFGGQDAEVIVDFLPDNNDWVYSVSAYVLCMSDEDAINKFNFYIQKMIRDYPYYISEGDNEYEKSFMIIDPQGDEPQVGDPVLGITSISIKAGPIETQYYIEISYNDIKGAEKAGLLN